MSGRSPAEWGPQALALLNEFPEIRAARAAHVGLQELLTFRIAALAAEAYEAGLAEKGQRISLTQEAFYDLTAKARDEGLEAAEDAAEKWVHMNIAGPDEDVLCESLIGALRALKSRPAKEEK